MAAGKKRIRWKGELAKPIRAHVVRPKGLAITDPETVAKANEEMIRLEKEVVAQKYLEKLGLLMEHYSIENKNDWFSLALALAVDSVPGFQLESQLVKLGVDWEGDGPHFSGPIIVERKKVGRRQEWTIDRLDQLLAAVEQRKAKDGIRTDREALSRLAQRGEWARPANHRGTLEGWIQTLESRLQDAKKFRRSLEAAEKTLAEIAHQMADRNSGN